MSDTRQLISDFVNSLESHPNGAQIIEIIQQILVNDSGSVDPLLITSLTQLCNNNASLLFDFWFLRGSILKEAGKDHESMQVFFEAIQWCPIDVRTWVRVADYFKGQNELLRGSFFLAEALKRFKSDSDLLQNFEHILEQLEINLAFPPGFLLPSSSLTVLSPPSTPSTPSSSNQSNHLTLPSTAAEVWRQALECFTEAIDSNKLIYLQAFIHYAHSTIRELLRLDGSFKAGLDRQIAQYGLFEYRAFFLKLNRLRNEVLHEDYIPSLQEAQGIHDQILHLLDSLKT
jgi:tetratricopeptide (TPR) repeat protein